VRVSVSVAIQDDKGRVLVVRRSRAETFLSGQWELPGGQVEDGEAPEAAARREVREECGLSVRVGPPLAVFGYESPAGFTVEIVFAGSTAERDVRLSPEHDRYAWVDRDGLKRMPCSGEIRRVLESLLP
jgi:8-oxo-dGTP diphosphatase